MQPWSSEMMKTMFGWGLAAAALEPKETAAAIVAIVVIHERRIRSAAPMTRKNELVIVTL